MKTKVSQDSISGDILESRSVLGDGVERKTLSHGIDEGGEVEEEDKGADEEAEEAEEDSGVFDV